MNCSIIVAIDKNNGIGKNNKIPWDIKEDLKYFLKITKHSICIMGYNTYKSIGKPLPNRYNIVITNKSNNLTSAGNLAFVNLGEIVSTVAEISKLGYKNVYIIGGESIYKLFIENCILPISYIYVTKIEKSYECDTYFPKLNFENLHLLSITSNYSQEEKCYYTYNIYKTN